MRPILIALLLPLALGWAAPAQAQWWDDGGPPCFRPCRPWMGPGGFIVREDGPRPFWAGRGVFGPPRRRFFTPWDVEPRNVGLWQPAFRPNRWTPEAFRPRPSAGRWAGRFRPVRERAAAIVHTSPARVEAAVAMMPADPGRPLRLRGPAAVPARLLATATAIKRPAIATARPVRVPSAAVRAFEAAPVRVSQAAALRSQPASRSPAIPAPASAPPRDGGDVPVAPLD